MGDELTVTLTVFLFMFFAFAFPMGTIPIEVDSMIGVGDQFEGFTLTAFTYSGAGSFINPRVYTISFRDNGHTFSYSFSNTPFHLSIGEFDFTIANHSSEQRLIGVAKGHHEIETLTMAGIIIEALEHGGFA